jgi:nicotinate-nucleotide adenylyltransferase
LKTGIFGGTFNPVHNGHLLNCSFVREKFGLERIILIPARMPVHKSCADIVSPAHRLKMLSIAVSPFPGLEVSSIEIDREQPSYTVITLSELMADDASLKPALIIGSDSFNELDTWREYREILKLADIIVISRPGSSALRKDILALSDKIFSAENPCHDISSTEIRRRIRNGKNVDEMLPKGVIEYIHNKGLYLN